MLVRPTHFHVSLHLQAFPSMERVLEGMHKIAVADISAQASVRKHIRELYAKFAVVSTGKACAQCSSMRPAVFF